MSDRHFMAREGTLPAPPADAIFSGADGVFRSPWWLRVIDGGLIAGVIVCTLVYAIGKGGTLDDTTVASVVARHPWLIWSTPVALCVIMLAQELLVRWEMQRPPLRLAGQPELAERADLHRRREAYKALFSDWTVFFSIPWLSMSYLMTFDGLVDSSIQFPLSLAAFLAWMLGIFVYGMADTRRKRLARRAGDAGLRGGGGVI